MVSRTNARVAVVLGLSLLIQFISAQTWTVQNRQIKKDGETFLVKGVNYAPLPPGSGVSEETQWGDLFHADWAHLHDRDLPLMRAAGVNSIRIYQLQLNYPNTNTELDHGSFFDKLYNNGDHSIYVMITYALSADWTYLGPFDAQPATGGYSFQVDGGKWYQIDDSTEEANALKREIQRNIVVEIATRYGTHPAVMGFVIGNEQNNAVTRANCKYWEWLDEIATAVKGAAPNKLTATTIVDDNFLTVAAAMQCSSLPHLDVWGINSYRGTELIGFDHLFDQFEALSNQALLITEFGCPSSTRDGDKFVMMPENSKLQGDYLQAHWDDIVAHSSVCSGGYAFSWIDEWWKIGNHGVQDSDNAQNFAFPGKWADEEAYGLLAVNVDCSAIDDWKTRKDSVLPRAVYYMMGKLFGAWTELPAQTTQPISYPRCNGEWVGEVNGPNPDIGVPLPTQGPVTSAPLGTLPPSTTTAPSVIATPIQDSNNNNNPNSASGVVCSLAVVIFSLIALVF